jgi:hypothetical protein
MKKEFRADIKCLEGKKVITNCLERYNLLRLQGFDENLNPNCTWPSFDLSDLKQQVAILQQQLLLKSNINDVCALVDLKADQTETTQAIENV